MGKTRSDNWGGKREGSGRPKGSGRQAVKTVSIAGTEKELLQLKEQAKQKNKNLSRYVIEELIKED